MSNLDSFKAKWTRAKKCQWVYSLLYAQASFVWCMCRTTILLSIHLLFEKY